MADYKRPDVYAEESAEASAPIEGVSTTHGAMQGVAEWGPIGETVTITSFDAFKRIYGSYRDGADLAYEVEEFFKQSGGKGLVEVNRLAHFNDITDPTSIVAAKATTTLKTTAGGATPGYIDSAPAIEFPFDLEDGYDIDMEVDAVPAVTLTIAGTAAVVTAIGAVYPLAMVGGESLVIKINDKADQTLSFVAGPAKTVEDVCAEINAQLKYASAEPAAGQIRITSDVKGNHSLVRIIGGTGAVMLGLAGLQNSVSGEDFNDLDQITYSEFKTFVETGIGGPPGSVVMSALGVGFRITSNTTGAASKVHVTGGSLAAYFDVPVDGQAAGAAVDTLRVDAKYYGLRGNSLAVDIESNPKHPSAGTGNDLSVDASLGDYIMKVVTPYGIDSDSLLRLREVAPGPTVVSEEYITVDYVETLIESGSPVHYVHFKTALAHAYTAAQCEIASNEFDLLVYESSALVERWEQMTMVDTDENYVETVVNDESTGSELVAVADLDAALTSPWLEVPAPLTDNEVLSGATDETSGLNNVDKIGSSAGKLGLYTFDAETEISMLATPGADATVLSAQSAYCDNRMFVFSFGDIPQGSTPASAKTWRIDSGFNSKRLGLYGPWIERVDPIGEGNNPKIILPPSGAVMGLAARVDSLPPPDGGVWSLPAGEGDFGQLRGLTGLEAYWTNEDQDLVHPYSINAIRKKGIKGILVTAGRTVSSNKKWRYINVVRLFIFAERSIVEGTSWAVNRNNDYRLWDKLRSRVSDFLSGIWKDGGLKGETEEDAFFVKVGEEDGVQTEADTDNGKVIGQVGLAPQKPGEFIIWRFSQYEGVTTVEE